MTNTHTEKKKETKIVLENLSDERKAKKVVRSRKDNFKRVDTAPVIPCFKMISEIIKVKDVLL